MASVSLADADRIIDATIEKGVDMGLAPLSVAVLDVGGNLVAFKKSDGSSLLRFEIALGKAWSALAMFTSSKQLGNVWQERPQFVTALMNASGGRSCLCRAASCSGTPTAKSSAPSGLPATPPTMTRSPGVTASRRRGSGSSSRMIPGGSGG